MCMQVKDHLPAAPVNIDKESIAALSHAEVLCYPCCSSAHVGKHGVVGSDVIERGNMLPRDNENVNRRRRIRVPKPHHEFVLIDYLRRNLPSRIRQKTQSPGESLMRFASLEIDNGTDEVAQYPVISVMPLVSSSFGRRRSAG